MNELRTPLSTCVMEVHRQETGSQRIKKSYKFVLTLAGYRLAINDYLL